MLERPDSSLSGSYSCQVSSQRDSHTNLRTANMIVFSPPTAASIQHRNNNLSCKISEVFPLPVVRLMVGSIPIRQDGTHRGMSQVTELSPTMVSSQVTK